MIMNSRRYITIAALLLLSSASIIGFAQDETDALRYSFIMPQGTARSMAFGSALGSVGGDFTSLSVNPAGIGIYRKGEIMFTPSVRFNTVNGLYLNDMNDDNTSKFNFNNIGIVFTRAERGKRYDKSSWKAVSFGLGLNRLADFNRSYTYGGLMKGSGDNYSSFSELFVASANADAYNVEDDQTLAFLGYESYLINKDSGGYYTLANWKTALNQRRSVTERGGINELVFSLGGNYEEKLMIGATLGLPFVRYTRENFFEETDASGDNNNDFASFRYSEDLATSGMGVNFKVGMIFKPNDLFRFGVAVHTPTWYTLSEVYNSNLTANTELWKTKVVPAPVNQNPVTSVDAPENRFNYKLLTPWRAVVSATAMMGQYGFFTADYEYVDYGSVRYNFENTYSTYESAQNNTIRNTYKGASNFRLGVEGRMDNFFLRGGFGYYGSPYKKSLDNTGRMTFSAGIGLRTGVFFADLGFVHTQYDEYEKPYLLAAPVMTPTAKLENRLNNIALTIGWKM